LEFASESFKVCDAMWRRNLCLGLKMQQILFSWENSSSFDWRKLLHLRKLWCLYYCVTENELLRCCRLSGSTSFASTAQFFVHVACGACSWNLCDTNRFHSLISFALLSLATSLHICSSKQSSLLLADSWVLSEYAVSDVE
jgi:hypothetical protein